MKRCVLHPSNQQVRRQIAALQRALHELHAVQGGLGQRLKIESRARQQVLGELIDFDHFALELAREIRITLRVLQKVDEHANSGQRRSNLVRDGRQELALILELFGDALGHLVDGAG